jgi:ParB family transcriptional regulator, chromosome partitioning protein
LARPDFRATAARRLAEERELPATIISLLAPEHGGHPLGVRNIPIDRIEPNPAQPRMIIDPAALRELAASVREHGVLQPVLVRPLDDGRYQLIAGERRWRAARLAQQATVPAMIEEIDDDTALEISIIENLQREDLTPLEEAEMYRRMTAEHGYSVRKLAQKLGKDKGYIENRLRLSDAPPEVRDLVATRKDTLSHAYELLKVTDPRKRKRLAEQVARGELTLAKLRDRIEGRRRRRRDEAPEEQPEAARLPAAAEPEEAPAASQTAQAAAEVDLTPITEDALILARVHLDEAMSGLIRVLGDPAARASIEETDRANLAKYLVIAKVRLENAIAALRS